MRALQSKRGRKVSIAKERKCDHPDSQASGEAILMEHVEGESGLHCGGSRGIGLEMAKAFLKVGMKVMIAEVQQTSLDKAMAQFGGNEICTPLRVQILLQRAVHA